VVGVIASELASSSGERSNPEVFNFIRNFEIASSCPAINRRGCPRNDTGTVFKRETLKKRGITMAGKNKITVYQKPTCTTCRQVYAALKESGADFEAVDYYLEPIPRAKIKELLMKMGMSAAQLLRKKESVYKELKFDEKKYSENEIIDLMTVYPDLIERPIVEQGDKAILARPAERLKEFLAAIS